MKPEKLRAKCLKQIELCGDSASVFLILPGRWGKRNTRRAWPGGPVGTIVADNHNGPGVVVMFSAKEVLEYLDKAEA